MPFFPRGEDFVVGEGREEGQEGVVGCYAGGVQAGYVWEEVLVG